MPDAPPEPASPSAGVVIRAARVSDFEGLAMIGAMPGFRSGTLRLPYRSPEETRHFLEGQGANDLALVAERDGAILGSAGWRRFEGRRAHIAAIGMGVHDAHVGRGIGTSNSKWAIGQRVTWRSGLRCRGAVSSRSGSA